jgi:hypothetical protein
VVASMVGLAALATFRATISDVFQPRLSISKTDRRVAQFGKLKISFSGWANTALPPIKLFCHIDFTFCENPCKLSRGGQGAALRSFRRARHGNILWYAVLRKHQNLQICI